MGIYVNPGNTLYKEAVNSRIYVDKSEWISYTNTCLNTRQKNLCISRPRRFGKSTAADMLVAYYSRGCDSAALFSGRKVENDISFQEHLNRHNVIRLDVQQFLESKNDADRFIVDMERAVVRELEKEFSDCGSFGDERLKNVLNQIFARKCERFVFVMDEWDCVFRLAKNREDAQKEYLDFLRGLFKGQEYVELAYMTGILPIKKYGEHSAINIFDEYSMIDPKNLSQYFGFTEAEVMQQCEKHGVPYLEMKNWYDGYLLGGEHIYNPKSVVGALIWKKFKSYWIGTETYEALRVYMDMDFDGLKETVTRMLGNGRCKISTRKFQNDMTTFASKDDVLTLLVHLGYLAFDESAEEVFIPNQEIEQEFLNAVDEPGWDGLAQALKQSESLLQSTWKLDGNAVADGVSVIHDETASLLKYNNENSLTCTVLMAYYSAKAYYMNPIMEFPSGKGLADVVYLPKRNMALPALVVELKWNKSAEGAIAQIKKKKYASWIEQYTGEILLVGINYQKSGKRHECVIEKYVKE